MRAGKWFTSCRGSDLWNHLGVQAKRELWWVDRIQRQPLSNHWLCCLPKWSQIPIFSWLAWALAPSVVFRVANILEYVLKIFAWFSSYIFSLLNSGGNVEVYHETISLRELYRPFIVSTSYISSLTCSVLSTVKTYCETSPVFERLSKPNNHVTPKRGNNTMQAFTVVLIKRNKLVIRSKSQKIKVLRYPPKRLWSHIFCRLPWVHVNLGSLV